MLRTHINADARRGLLRLGASCHRYIGAAVTRLRLELVAGAELDLPAAQVVLRGIGVIVAGAWVKRRGAIEQVLQRQA